MVTDAGEILDKSIKELAALICKERPVYAEVKQKLIHVIVAADCVEEEKKVLLEALGSSTDQRERLRDQLERSCHLYAEAMELYDGAVTYQRNTEGAFDGVMDMLRQADKTAESVIAAYVESRADMKGVSDPTRWANHLCNTLREIGVSIRSVYTKYDKTIKKEEAVKA